MEYHTDWIATLVARTRSNGRGFLAILLLSAAPLGLAVALNLRLGIPYAQLTRDVTAAGGISLYVGILSQLGLLFWAAAAALCLFTAALLQGSVNTTPPGRFFMTAGWLTLLLCLDDAFLLHEALLPRAGIPELLVLSAYGGAILAFLVAFRRSLQVTGFPLLAVALGFFGLSIIGDFFHPPGIDPFLFEDGAKLIGIVGWLVYFAVTGLDTLRQRAALSGRE